LQLFINFQAAPGVTLTSLSSLSFRRKSILAGELNTKHQFWNTAVSNPSGVELLHLFDTSQFEISAPQCPTHYSHVGNGDVLDIVVHQNIRVSDVIVSDIFDSAHLPIVFNILDHSCRVITTKYNLKKL
jgi:hypothetical protein